MREKKKKKYCTTITTIVEVYQEEPGISKLRRSSLRARTVSVIRIRPARIRGDVYQKS